MECKRRMQLLNTGVVLGLLLPVQSLWAETWVDRTRLDGFFSARYSITDQKEAWLNRESEAGINDDGSFYGTKMGLNIMSQLNDRITVASQLFSTSQDNNFNTHVDWVFASFQLNDEFALRAGKIKYPVGLVNEYVEVGVAYPWIQAPVAIYSDQLQGPQATREAYTGASLLWDHMTGDWVWGMDLFGGQVDLEQMSIKQMIGITGRANWDDTVMFQLSAYQGDMQTNPGMNMMMAAMNNRQHKALTGGVKIDWNNWLVYAEAAKVEMDFKMMGVAVGDSDSWYTTLGYRFGKWMPHVTYQDWSRDNDDGQQISTLGLNYNLTNKVVIKTEVSQIDTDANGLFVGRNGMPIMPDEDSTNMFSLAVDAVF